MKPFNLAKALAGEPISFKGYKAYVHCSKKEENSYIVESAVSNMVWSPVDITELSECTMWFSTPRPTIKTTVGGFMKPFNLEEALKGKPITYKDSTNSFGHIIGYSETIEGHLVVEWDSDNLVHVGIENLERDFRMYEESRPTVSLTLPCPLKEPQEVMWFITPRFTILRSVLPSGSKAFLEDGRYFASEADAQAWLDALRNNRK